MSVKKLKKIGANINKEKISNISPALKPRSISRWCKCVLSGEKGFLLLRILKTKTLSISNPGSIKAINISSTGKYISDICKL